MALKHTRPNRARGCRPETEAMYGEALALYAGSDLTKVEICRRCGVSLGGFSRYIRTYHRDLMLRRGALERGSREARGEALGQRTGQRRDTRARYREAVEACDSMEYIACNVSEIAREFGLDGSGLGRQLRTHYPGVIERREEARERLGLGDGLPRGMRPRCRERYAEAVELLRSDRYITVQEAAARCDVSYTGLEQHLLLYHRELVDNRIEIRRQAVRRQRRGEITGRGTPHAASPEITGKYAEALRLYRTTPLSARKIAGIAGVSVKGFYEYLQKWHRDLVCERKGVAYEEGRPVDWSSVRRYSPAAAAKYAEAIARLREGGLTVAKAAEEFGLNADSFRQYLKEHEPALHAGLGMRKSDEGKMMSAASMEKYGEAVRLYETTPESLKSIARRLGLNDCSLGQFIRRQFPQLHERRRKQPGRRGKAE